MSRKNPLVLAGLIAAVVGGAIWAAVPVSTILLLGVFLACPLMMLSMHGGQGSSHAGHTGHAGHDVDPAARGDHSGHQHGPVDGHDRLGANDPATRR